MFAKLLGLQYRVVYKRGVDNGAADALSRRPTADATLFGISSVVPQWLLQVTDSYTQDPQV
jgi:hypothetical protein